MQHPLNPKISVFFGLPIVLFYGLFIRLTFGSANFQDSIGDMVTVAFIFVVPFVLGLLTMAVLPRRLKGSIKHAIFMPWVACGILVAGTACQPSSISTAVCGPIICWAIFKTIFWLSSKTGQKQLHSPTLLRPDSSFVYSYDNTSCTVMREAFQAGRKLATLASTITSTSQIPTPVSEKL